MHARARRRLAFVAALFALPLGALAMAHALRSRPDLWRFAQHAAQHVRRRLAATAEAHHPPLRPATPPGLAIWTLDDSTKVFPGDLLGDLNSSTASPPYTLFGARGETVAFQIVLASAQGSPDVDVEPTALTADAGVIAAERLQVFFESYIYCGPVPEKGVSLGDGEYPDALIPLRRPDGQRLAAPFPLKARRNQPLWVDVAIPRDAPPGRYAGSLRVTAAGHARAEVRIELSVYGFDLPARPQLFAWVPLYSWRLYQREEFEGLDAAARREITQRYFRMAHDHRFATQIMDDQPDLEWDVAKGRLIRADWAAYDALNGPVLGGSLFEDREPPALWKVGGFVWWGARPGDGPNFGGNYEKDSELTPAHRLALGEYAHEVARHFRERGWSKSRPFMYMIDEPDLKESPNLARIVKAYGEALHDAREGIAHLVTIGPEQTPLALGAVDIWATWGAGYYPRRMRERQSRGELTWFYQQHEPFVGGNCINNEGLGMRTWPWIAWRYGVDGVFLWVGNFWDEAPYSNSKNWNDTLLGNGVFFYPGAGLPSIGFPKLRGPVSSFRMKALRRGLFDYEYFQLLRSLGGHPDPIVARVVHSALNAREYEPYWEHPLWGRPGDWSHDPADWEAARWQVAQEILVRRARRAAE